MNANTRKKFNFFIEINKIINTNKIIDIFFLFLCFITYQNSLEKIIQVKKMPRTLAMLLEAKRREKNRIRREIKRNNGVRKNDMLKEIVERNWDMEELDLHITDRKW